MPVRNEEAFIADTLQQLLGQHYEPDQFEVIVADGCSTDNTRTIVAALQTEYANLRLLDNPRRWSSAGRNAAVRASRGDIILLIDGHCELSNPHYLQNLADAFVESGADCVGRPQPLDVTGANRVQRAIAAARASRLGHHPASHIYSDREGFVPAAERGHRLSPRRLRDGRPVRRDVRRLRGRGVQSSRGAGRPALLVHAARARALLSARSLTGLFRQMMRYGRGRVRLLRKHPDTFSLPGFMPAAFLAGVVVGPLLACWSSLLSLLYLGVLAVYAATLLLFSLALSVRHA